MTVVETTVRDALKARVCRLMAQRAALAERPLTWENRVDTRARWVSLTAQINAALEAYNEADDGRATTPHA